MNGLEVVSMGTEQISDKTEKQKRDGYRSFYNRVTKRVLDLVLALAGSVIVTPILLVIGIFIAIEDGFPIFYTPLRGGYHGKPFHIIKLRTMYKGADKLGGTTALNDRGSPGPDGSCGRSSWTNCRSFITSCSGA